MERISLEMKVKPTLRNSQKVFNWYDAVFMLIFVSLFLFVLLDLYGVRMDLLFRHKIEGMSMYSFISGILIGYYFILWGCLKIKHRIKKKENMREIILDALTFIGLKKPTIKGFTYALLAAVIGAIFNYFSLLIVAHLYGGTLVLTRSLDLLIVMQNLVFASISEEIIFRGIYLSVFTRILGKTRASAAWGIIMSSFTFGWIHLEKPILKVAAGLLLAVIYLFKWKKNLIASIAAHLGANSAATGINVITLGT